jgi:DNA-binding response OmpR family regulator
MTDTLSYFRTKTLLYAEDDNKLQLQAKVVFDAIFGNVFVAGDGLSALKIFEEKSIDVIITDIKMPRLDGLEFSQIVRKKDATIPIILTTAYDDKPLLKSALKLNITSYIEKPYDMKALESTLVEVLEVMDVSGSLVGFGDGFAFDMQTMLLSHRKEDIPLKPQERMILKLLLSAPNHMVSYSTIEYALSDDGYTSKEALRTAISSLRKKIGKETIQNISKQGYRLCE